MKHLFFVAVATGILSGTSISVQAQANVNLEKLVVRSQPKPSPKFIEDIELKPEASATNLPLEQEKYRSASTSSAVTVSHKNFPGRSIEESAPLQFKYALVMDREVEQLSNAALYNVIDDWWGTRYRYGGNDRKGIDCSAFTGRLLLDVYGITAPRVAKDQFDVCEKIDAANLVEGDLVFFNTRGGVSHVGLYLGDNFFVHSSVHGGVTINNLTEDYYSRKFIGGGRICMK